jgi:hypothetical protein
VESRETPLIAGRKQIQRAQASFGNGSISPNYPQIPDDYVRAFAVLKSLPCDLFLGAHGAYFGMKAKYEKMKTDGGNPFIDPEGYKAYVAEREGTFRAEWARQQRNPGTPAGR